MVWDAPIVFSPQQAALLVVAILIWEFGKKVWASSFSAPSASSSLLRSTTDADKFKKALQVDVPSDPHLEVALDPPCGLHHSNPSQVYDFEHDRAQGSYLFFHAPTGDGNQFGPDNFDYGDYFQGKSRLWEMRVHFKFKKPPVPGETNFFGIELEDYVPLSRASAQAQKVIVKGIRRAIGNVYHTPGDDPRKTEGECAQPCCVLPLWAFDQFIVTPEGEEPPSLTDPNFSKLGKRRYRRIAEYAKEIKELEEGFEAGPTYTFAFWGNSRFLDVINWSVVGVPIVSPCDFNLFCGRPPVHVVWYSLPKQQGSADGEQKHFKSLKTYHWRCAIWSSLRRPDPERVAALVNIKSLVAPVIEGTPVKKRRSSLLPHLAAFVSQVSSRVGLGACSGGLASSSKRTLVPAN